MCARVHSSYERPGGCALRCLLFIAWIFIFTIRFCSDTSSNILTKTKYLRFSIGSRTRPSNLPFYTKKSESLLVYFVFLFFFPVFVGSALARLEKTCPRCAARWESGCGVAAQVGGEGCWERGVLDFMHGRINSRIYNSTRCF